MRERALHAKPFAIVEQREVARLRDLGARDVHLVALLVLRVRANNDGEVRDGYRSLADWAGMSVNSMRGAIHWLVQHHIVTQLEREHVSGRRLGSQFCWPRRISPFELWAASPKAEAIPLWREEGRRPTYEELLTYKAAGGRI